MNAQEAHNQIILDQFTRQAQPFAAMAEHSDEDAMKQLLKMVAAQAEDRVLDVACGPGLVACAIAPHVGEVHGIDIAPAMIELAGRTQKEREIGNVYWRVGDVDRLPYPDGSFSLVVSRYAFHHFMDPLKVLREMKRVVRGDGRILIVDVTPAPECQEAYDRVERLRDPSHASARTISQFQEMFDEVGMEVAEASICGLRVSLEKLLANSFPKPGAADEVRRIFAKDVAGGQNELGVNARREEDGVYFQFPITAMLVKRAE